ncbi:hypothetical protein SAMN05216266_101152 [Amycolatopsis marina]|uniref:Uncharacterized protein n=1 Tax=Amycolatopsis marina TaxID=490629 RepID=A0A1I0VC52_9PSEU|nr:hypothetical protein [Amycolatopsis marina]SFA73911.1 hypothetical protein SAMN05216266_101152 [Amycolatopsis marina]
MDTATGGWSPVPESWTGSGRLPPGPDASAKDGAVVAVGAVCDVAVPWNESTGQISFALSEYLDLESGKRVVLHSERGVTVGVRGGYSSSFTARELRDFFLGALLPDEGDDDPEEPHPWTWLAELAATRGVTVTPEELKSLPYELEFRPAVQTLIRSDEP